MANTPVISTTTNSATYDFSLVSGATGQVYCSPDLKLREKVTLSRNVDGTNYIPVHGGPRGDILLTEGKNSAIITGPGDFRINKPATAIGVAIFLDL